MKTRYLLIILIFSFSGCEEEISITKTHLNFDSLLIVSSTNQYFEAFIDDHTDNILSMSALSENDYLNLGVELEMLRMEQKNENEIYSIMSRFNLKASAYLNFQLFHDFLNSNFTYADEDLKELIEKSIGDRLAAQRSKCCFMGLTCGTVCAIHSAAVKQQYLDLGFSSNLAGAMGAQGYTSCMYGCNYF